MTVIRVRAIHATGFLNWGYDMARRALLAWEMGGGLGHIRRLMVVARAVEAAGFEPVIAQRTIHTLADEVREAGYPMIPIPPQVSLAPKNEPFRALTYADIMAICGYAKMDALEPTLDAWDGLLNYIQPSVVIGDYCPILPMAVRGRYPYLAFGDGFVVPPHDPPGFPPLRAHGAPIKPVDEITSDVNSLLASVSASSSPGMHRSSRPCRNSISTMTAGNRKRQGRLMNYQRCARFQRSRSCSSIWQRISTIPGRCCRL